MALTYQAIATVTVGSGGAANIEFTSIPQTYTDLLVKISSRSASDTVQLLCHINGSALDSGQRLNGSGSAASSSSAADAYGVNSSAYTASTFGNTEYYFPNYTGSNNKSVSVDAVTENNATGAYMSLGAALESTSSAITSLKFLPSDSYNFAQYSTATLYGIKNTV